jgi:heparanase 1
MVRQSLIGGDYGLVDRLTRKPRPDFWASWLWGNLMGTAVYPVRSSLPWVRAYLHEDPSERGMTLLLLNLSEQVIPVNLENLGEVTDRFTLWAKKPTSRKLLLNGIRPRLDKGRVQLKDFPAALDTQEIAGRSITFWRLR